MEVLIDTNVLIEREGDWVISEPLQELENLLKSKGHTILVHPLSKEEIQRYENDERRETAASKSETYPELSFPEYPTSSDTEFRTAVSEGDDFNEQVDNALLYAVFQDRVDLLITEDKGIHQKAGRLGVAEEVLTIAEARDRFKDDDPAYEGPPSIEKVTVEELDIDDPIFDSLKREYAFEEWFESIPDERDAWVNWQPDGTLGAVLIVKPNESEVIGADPELPRRERLKICTLKVAVGQRGSKIGELLVSIAIREAMHHGLEEVYLTHRIREDDYLVQLISQYGFEHTADEADGEAVFVKRLTPGPGDDPDPFEVNVRFYPSFYDGDAVGKFLIPIKPTFHGRLFQTYEKRDTKLVEFKGQFLSEGNAIKKAYLSHANTRQIEQGDVLLFYRSQDHKEVTSLGVCEQVRYGVTDVAEILDLVGRRSVFHRSEIEERAAKPTTVLLFKWHFDLADPVHYKVLLDEGVLKGPPQTIQGLEEKDYQFIRKEGGIDERFVVN